MKDKKERKIAFNTLIKKTWKTQEETSFKEIEDVIAFIKKQKKLDRKMDFKDSKFCILQDATLETVNDKKIITGYFKSAKDNFRPNLIDRNTGDERSSPKRITEGDIEKTHFCIKINDDEVFLLIEVNGNGVSINQIVDYFGFFTKRYYKAKKEPKNFSVIYAKMGKDDFLKELKQLKRTRVAEIYFDKKLLGSSALNFSDRTSSIKRDLVLTATAQKNESIKEAAIDFYNKFSTDSNGISKVRIFGRDDDNNNVILDTSFIEKIEQLNSSLNTQTGEIVTSEILTNLKAFVKIL